MRTLPGTRLESEQDDDLAWIGVLNRPTGSRRIRSERGHDDRGHGSAKSRDDNPKQNCQGVSAQSAETASPSETLSASLRGLR